MDLDLKEINWATTMIYNGNFNTILIREREKEKMCALNIKWIRMQQLEI